MPIRNFLKRDKEFIRKQFLKKISCKHSKAYYHTHEILETLLTGHPEILDSKKLKSLILKLSGETEKELYQISRGKLSFVSDDYTSYCTHAFRTLLDIAKHSSILIADERIEEILGRISSEKMVIHGNKLVTKKPGKDATGASN